MPDNYPHEALAVIADILKVGEQKGYEPGYWRSLPFGHHVHKAMTHLHAYYLKFYGHKSMAVDDGEDHLAHALVRLAMALSLREPDEHQR